jgi:hypothetical protein
MAQFTSPLDNIRIAAPCSSDWNQMMGDERVRFCQQCSLNVYNLSSMTRREAEALISNTEGRLCVRYYRRRDGTVLTKNCPEGLRAIKRRLSRVASAALSAVLSFFTGVSLNTTFQSIEKAAGADITKGNAQTSQMPAVTGLAVVEIDDMPGRTIKGRSRFDARMRKLSRR